MYECYAIRWARREVRHAPDWSKWHWTTNGDWTICGKPITIGDTAITPETDDEPERVDCKDCKRALGLNLNERNHDAHY